MVEKPSWAEVLEDRDTLYRKCKSKVEQKNDKVKSWKDFKKKFINYHQKAWRRNWKSLKDTLIEESKKREYFTNHEEQKNYQSWICELRFKFQRVRTMKSGERQYLPPIWPFSVFSVANPDFSVFSNADVVLMQSQCQTLKQTLML